MKQNMIFTHLSQKNCLYLVLISAIAILATVYSFEYLLGLAPCDLCLYQRLPWWGLIALSCLALMLRPNPRLSILLFACMIVILLAGASMAGYHVGVEWLWWKGPTTCSGFDARNMDLATLKAAIMATPVVRCDEIVWDFLGLSMAGWNFILSCGLALFLGIFLRFHVKS